jgi:hypothetical protein
MRYAGTYRAATVRERVPVGVEGMPTFWKNVEGPVVIGFGTAILTLTLRLKPVAAKPGEPVNEK